MDALKLSNNASNAKANTQAGKNLTDEGKNDTSNSGLNIFNILIENHISESENSLKKSENIPVNRESSSEKPITEIGKEEIEQIENIQHLISDILDFVIESDSINYSEFASLLENLEKILSLKGDELDFDSILEIAEIVTLSFIKTETDNENNSQSQDLSGDLNQIQDMIVNMLQDLSNIFSEMVTPKEEEEIKKKINTDTHQESMSKTDIKESDGSLSSTTENTDSQITKIIKEPKEPKEPKTIHTKEKILTPPKTNSTAYNNPKNKEIEKNIHKIETLLEKISSVEEKKSHSINLAKIIEEKVEIISKDLKKISLTQIETSTNSSNIKQTVKEISTQFLQEIKNILDKYGTKIDSSEQLEDKEMKNQQTFKKEITSEIKHSFIDLSQKDPEDKKWAKEILTKESIETQQDNKSINKTEAQIPDSKDLQNKEPILKERVFEQVEKGFLKAVNKTNGNQQLKQFMLNLEPKELGKVRVMLEFSKNELRAIIKVENEDVKAVVRENLPKLREALAVNGVNVSEMQVDVNDKNNNFLKEFAKKGGSKSFSNNANSAETDSDEAKQNSGKLFSDSKYEVIV